MSNGATMGPPPAVTPLDDPRALRMILAGLVAP
jgi:hypothetical protein